MIGKYLDTRFKTDYNVFKRYGGQFCKSDEVLFQYL